MSFQNLEQRFNASVKKLYAGAKLKFEDGKPASGPFNDPILVRTPGDGQTGIKTEGRSLPFVSAPRDLKRLTLFQISKSGIMFLLKQQLLQTGNTFEQTRLINPLFVIANAIPFIHVRRHLRPISGLLGSTDRSTSNVKKLGQLQKTTYDTAGKEPERGAGKFLKSLASPITNTVSAFTAKKNVGEEFGYDDAGWKKTRPELGESDDGSEYFVTIANKSGRLFRFGGEVTYTTKFGIGEGDTKYKTYLSQTNDKETWTHVDLGYGVHDSQSPLAQESDILTKYNDSQIVQETLEGGFEATNTLIDTFFKDFTQESTQPFLRYFDSDIESISELDAGETIEGGRGAKSLNAQSIANNRTNKEKRISYIRDPSNLSSDKRLTPSLYTGKVDVDTAYRELTAMGTDPTQKNFDDPIVVSFAMGNKNHVQFRAFITGLQQNANPEYTPLQYIGRVEKFINFKGIQREVGFKLGVIAYSKDELDLVWTRINYLTGLVYPYGFSRGILQPNIVRLTIGNIYNDQPGYITSMNTDFSGMSETWDIDRQVTIGATMDIKFVIIEKSTKIASSPFYAITEDLMPTTIPDNPPTTAPQQTTQAPASSDGSVGQTEIEKRNG